MTEIEKQAHHLDKHYYLLDMYSSDMIAYDSREEMIESIARKMRSGDWGIGRYEIMLGTRLIVEPFVKAAQEQNEVMERLKGESETKTGS